MKLSLSLLIFLCFNISNAQEASLNSATAQKETESALTASFTANKFTLCQGEFVQFTDLSSGTPTTWNWQFSGGAPATSTLQNPVVQFNSPGSYNVILNASNLSDQSTSGKLNFIRVEQCTSLRDNTPVKPARIYPVPANDQLTVLSEQSATYTVTDLCGRLILNGYIEADHELVVQIANLSPGLYFFTLDAGAMHTSSKFIKE